jgi:hypothetical protein
MADNVVNFPDPQVDLSDVYLALLDSGMESHAKKVRARMSRADSDRAAEMLRAEAEIKLRRAKALESWLRQRILRRGPSVIREISPGTLRVVQGFVELGGFRVAQLIPGLRLSLLDRLTEAFDLLEDLEDLEEAE